MDVELCAIGTEIRKARKAAHLTQVQAAEKAGIAVNSLRLYEGGKRSPTFDTAVRLAAAFDVPVASLFGIDVEAVDAFAEELNKIMMEHYDAITDSFNKLNALGQAEAVKRIEELTHIDKYRAE